MERAIKKHSFKLPAKASFWYIASAVFSRGVSAIGTPLFTRLLLPEEYGLYPLYNTWLAFFSVIITLELSGNAILRELQKCDKKRSELIFSGITVNLVSFLIVLFIYVIFHSFINSITGLSTGVTLILLFQVIINSVVSFHTALAKYEYRYKTVALTSFIIAIGSPLISVILIRFTNLRATARIVGGLITTFAAMILPLIYLFKGKRGAFDFSLQKRLIKSALPLIPYYISTTLILRVGEMAVGRFHGTGALGKYSVAMSLGMSLTMISTAALSALSPWIIRKVKSGKLKAVREFLFPLTVAISLICIFLLCFIPEVMQLVVPEEYYSCLPAVFPLALTIIPIFISGAVMSEGLYYEKNGKAAIPAVLVALCSVLASILILPRIDFRFASVFAFLSYTALCLLNTFIFKKISGEFPIELKKTALLFLFVMFYAVLIFLLKGVFISRLLLFISLLPAAVGIAIKIVGEIRER